MKIRYKQIMVIFKTIFRCYMVEVQFNVGFRPALDCGLEPAAAVLCMGFYSQFHVNTAIQFLIGIHALLCKYDRL